MPSWKITFRSALPVLALAAFALCGPSAMGKEVKTARTESQPAEVTVGVYVNQIYDLSVRENSFVADFWIWFRWKDDRLKPQDTFNVIGSREMETEHVSQDPDKKNGYHYAQARVTANIAKAFDIQHFPRDNHNLAIQIEDGQAGMRVQYLPDVENCALSKDVQVPGWVLEHPRATVAEWKANASFGDPTTTPVSKSRFQFAVDLIRPGWGGFVKLYLALFLSSMIAILSFKITPGEIDARLALVLTALLGVMLSQFIVVKELPDTTSLTVTDKRHALGLLVVFIALADTGWGKYMCQRHKAEFAARIDQLAFFVITGAYVALNCWISL